MFYVLIIPAFIMSLFMIVHLLSIKRHDKVLFQLCHIRREVMSLLRDDNFDMPRDDYISLRRLLDALNINIHHYKKHKSLLFNFRD